MWTNANFAQRIAGLPARIGGQLLFLGLAPRQPQQSSLFRAVNGKESDSRQESSRDSMDVLCF